jgi:hypothetical protein
LPNIPLPILSEMLRKLFVVEEFMEWHVGLALVFRLKPLVHFAQLAAVGVFFEASSISATELIRNQYLITGAYGKPAQTEYHRSVLLFSS